MKKIYLIDVSAMFFRAFYAVRPLTSPSGMPVNAIYGFLSMIIKLFKEEKPEYFVFCYDRKEPSFRKEMYDDYKANRSEMPEELAQQIPYIKKLGEYLGIPALEIAPYEADDIIGTLVKWGRRQDFEVQIISGDKDFSQLIENHVFLYDTMKGVRYDAKGVFEKWGVRPDQFIDFQAIVGDSSDNIPGVKGIGEKGAAKLLEQFKSLEDIYENIDQVSSKSIKEKLVANKEMAELSKKLVTISIDVPVPDEPEFYKLQSFKMDELIGLMRELNFKTFEKTLTSMASGESVEPAGVMMNPVTEVLHSDTNKASESSEIQAAIHIIKDNMVFVEKEMSTRELTEYFVENQKLWGFSLNEQVYVGTDKEIIKVSDFEHLGLLTDTYKIQWNGFDLKSLWHLIGCENPIAAWDSQLAAYVLKAGDTSDFKKIYSRYLLEEILPEWNIQQYYNAHLNLAKNLQEEMQKVSGEKVYQQLDLPLAKVLLQMEVAGVRIDVELLQKLSAELAIEIDVLEKDIHTQAGEVFNVASPKQLGVILFEKMGLPAGKKTKTGYSTDEEVLTGLDHPIAKSVLKYRELAKLKSTYVDALPTMANPQDGRIHTRFNQALTTTGRLSSTSPNLQNIPIRTPRGQMVRKAFIAAPRKKLLSVDYSQIELRILAHISEDPGLCRAFADNLDIHAATAAEVFGVSLSDVTSDHRRTAKAVNFGIAYGQGVFGLAETLGISRTESKEIIDRYFSKFKNVREYIDGTVKFAHEHGYVETLFGRRRYIEELNAKNMALKKFGERAAINAPIQGTASDLVKKAMIELSEKVDSPMLLQVHDELIFEDFEDNLRKNVNDIVAIMEGVMTLKVPLKVNYSIGDNWDEAH